MFSTPDNLLDQYRILHYWLFFCCLLQNLLINIQIVTIYK